MYTHTYIYVVAICLFNNIDIEMLITIILFLNIGSNHI